MNCPQCGKPIETQQHRAAQSRWSQMSKSERSAEMSRIRRKGIKKPKRVARRSNELFQESFGFRPNGPNKNDMRKHANGDKRQVEAAVRVAFARETTVSI